jgi:hypothetical protein
MFGGAIFKAISSIAVFNKFKPDLLSKPNLTFASSLSKNLSSKSLPGTVQGQLGLGLLSSTLSSLDVSGNKTLAANPALRDAIVALQKQAVAGNAKAVTKAYLQF